MNVGRWADIRPLGGACADHARIVVEGSCYWHLKCGWLTAEHLSKEQLAFIGGRDPFVERPEFVAAHRGWSSLVGTAFDRLTERQLDEYDRIDGAARLVLSPETLDDLQAMGAVS